MTAIDGMDRGSIGAAVAGLVVLGTGALWGCARESAAAPQSPATPTQGADVVVAPSTDGGDVHGFRWGDPIASVLATEATRSRPIPGTSGFETTLAGVPVQLYFGSNDGQLASASYLVVWPDEPTSCVGVPADALAGSACSLQSAAYVIDAYRRIEALLVAQFGEKFMVSRTESAVFAKLPFGHSATGLDQLLTAPDAMQGVGIRGFGNERVAINAFYLAPRAGGSGWRLKLEYGQGWATKKTAPEAPVVGLEKAGMQEER